jgi:hypothetical protein
MDEQKPTDDIEQLTEQLCAVVGRCVLIYQAIEQLLKQLLPLATIEGSIQDSQFVRAKDSPNVEFQTLGVLVGALKAQVLKTDDQDEGDSRADFRTTFRVLLSHEDRQKCCDALDALVAERNKMVHHFYDQGISRTSANDLRSAIERTTGALARAREQRAFVVDLVKRLQSTIAEQAAFMGSPEFESMFELAWLRETATVKVLQSALSESRHPEGWLPVATAGHRVHADPTAEDELKNARERFGLKSLSDFVRASGLFEMGEEAIGTGTRTVYRLAPFVVVPAQLAVQSKNA